MSACLRFLTEAETGYLSACDDLKEADNALERRKRMLMNLERELREYSLKSFINTGFNEKGERCRLSTVQLFYFPCAYRLPLNHGITLNHCMCLTFVSTASGADSSLHA